MTEFYSPSSDLPKQTPVPISVLMITLNEGHNLEAVFDNLDGWAAEVLIVDSYSKDDTVDIALKRGAHVVQRAFDGFGHQWNFALAHLPISQPWTMKLDPDERISDELKASIANAIAENRANAFNVTRRWWLITKPLPIRENILRIWRTGICRFGAVTVNEHPVVDAMPVSLSGTLEHLDSPSLEHWFEKQNRYSSAEAENRFLGGALSEHPKLFGTPLQRRMMLKRLARRLPLTPLLFFLYYYLIKGTWRAGRVGLIAARLWADNWRIREYKFYEMQLLGHIPPRPTTGKGLPDPRVAQYDAAGIKMGVSS